MTKDTEILFQIWLIILSTLLVSYIFTDIFFTQRNNANELTLIKGSIKKIEEANIIDTREAWECYEYKTEEKHNVIEADEICTDKSHQCIDTGFMVTCFYDSFKYKDCMKTQKAELQFYNETTCIKEHLVRDVQ